MSSLVNKETRVKTNLASAGFSWCLLSILRVPQACHLCLDSVLQPPSPCCLPGLTEGSSYLGQAQVGIKAPGNTFQISNVSQYHHHSSWSNNQFSDPRVSKSGHRTLLGSILVKAIGFQKHQVPTLLAKQPLYKGGSEPAENYIPVSCCLRLFSSLNVIMQAQCPWTTTHGRVMNSKTWLRKKSSNSAHLKNSLRKKKIPWVFPLMWVWFQLLPLHSHFWLGWRLP